MKEIRKKQPSSYLIKMLMKSKKKVIKNCRKIKRKREICSQAKMVNLEMTMKENKEIKKKLQRRKKGILV